MSIEPWVGTTKQYRKKKLTKKQVEELKKNYARVPEILQKAKEAQKTSATEAENLLEELE